MHGYDTDISVINPDTVDDRSEIRLRLQLKIVNDYAKTIDFLSHQPLTDHNINAIANTVSRLLPIRHATDHEQVKQQVDLALERAYERFITFLNMQDALFQNLGEKIDEALRQVDDSENVNDLSHAASLTRQFLDTQRNKVMYASQLAHLVEPHAIAKYGDFDPDHFENWWEKQEDKIKQLAARVDKKIQLQNEQAEAHAQLIAKIKGLEKDVREAVDEAQVVDIGKQLDELTASTTEPEVLEKILELKAGIDEKRATIVSEANLKRDEERTESLMAIANEWFSLSAALSGINTIEELNALKFNELIQRTASVSEYNAVYKVMFDKITDDYNRIKSKLESEAWHKEKLENWKKLVAEVVADDSPLTYRDVAAQKNRIQQLQDNLWEGVGTSLDYSDEFRQLSLQLSDYEQRLESRVREPESVPTMTQDVSDPGNLETSGHFSDQIGSTDTVDTSSGVREDQEVTTDQSENSDLAKYLPDELMDIVASNVENRFSQKWAEKAQYFSMRLKELANKKHLEGAEFYKRATLLWEAATSSQEVEVIISTILEGFNLADRQVIERKVASAYFRIAAVEHEFIQQYSTSAEQPKSEPSTKFVTEDLFHEGGENADLLTVYFHLNGFTLAEKQYLYATFATDLLFRNAVENSDDGRLQDRIHNSISRARLLVSRAAAVSGMGLVDFIPPEALQAYIPFPSELNPMSSAQALDSGKIAISVSLDRGPGFADTTIAHEQLHVQKMKVTSETMLRANRYEEALAYAYEFWLREMTNESNQFSRSAFPVDHFYSKPARRLLEFLDEVGNRHQLFPQLVNLPAGDELHLLRRLGESKGVDFDKWMSGNSDSAIRRSIL